MIAAEDRVVLAPGVELHGATLVDTVRGAELAVNESARIVLARADGATIASLGSRLREAGARDGVRDALAFCTELNARFLLNVEIPLAVRVRRRVRAFAFGIVLRVPPRRVGCGSAMSVLRAVAPAGVTLTTLLLPLALAVGAWTIAAVVAAGAGIVLHELAHALALRGVPSALVLHGLRPTLLHPRLGRARTIAVAAAGPLAPALIAVAAALLWQPCSLAGAPLGAHALGLTVLSPDGRNACGLS